MPLIPVPQMVWILALFMPLKTTLQSTWQLDLPLCSLIQTDLFRLGYQPVCPGKPVFLT